jgi:cell division protein FtsQ
MRMPRLPTRRRPPARVVAGFAAVAVLLGGGWLWLRDSSFVAVRHVTVTGVSGPEAPRVVAALQDAAHDMTTLHVRSGQLTTAVEPFPAVERVDAHADFPHGMRIVVHEHVPVAVVVSGADRVPVAADGTLLRGTVGAGLPVISASAPPAGQTLSDRRVREAVALLGSAPPALRAKVRRVYLGQRGLTAPLRNGPVLYFGGGDRLRAKWIAAARVLADRSSAGATYVDLQLPERPAAGGLEQVAPPAQQTQPTTTTPTQATTTPATPTP